jgi:hypothetical protein
MLRRYSARRRATVSRLSHLPVHCRAEQRMAHSWTSGCDSPTLALIRKAVSPFCVTHSSLGMILQRASVRWRKAIFTASSKTSTELPVLPTRRPLLRCTPGFDDASPMRCPAYGTAAALRCPSVAWNALVRTHSAWCSRRHAALLVWMPIAGIDARRRSQYAWGRHRKRWIPARLRRRIRHHIPVGNHSSTHLSEEDRDAHITGTACSR